MKLRNFKMAKFYGIELYFYGIELFGVWLHNHTPKGCINYQNIAWQYWKVFISYLLHHADKLLNIFTMSKNMSKNIAD